MSYNGTQGEGFDSLRPLQNSKDKALPMQGFFVSDASAVGTSIEKMLASPISTVEVFASDLWLSPLKHHNLFASLPTKSEP